jgi:hypothetical protein
MAKPYMTSSDLISAIKRKIAFPISQNTFSEQNLLDFCNEELMISQVPSVLQYHEEYFVMTEDVPLVANQRHYEIPSRSIGMKLRDLFFKDPQGNLFEMTRIQSEDRAFYQRNIGANQTVYTFFLEGNDIVLTPLLMTNPQGSLHFVFYLRPNQLVEETRVATISSFIKNIVISNTSLVAGDILSIGDVDFTAVSGSPGANEFQIGGTSIITTSNLISSINTNGTVGTATVGSTTTTVEISYTDVQQEFVTLNLVSFVISSLQGVKFTDAVPSNITDLSDIDFMQTRPGHRIRGYDVMIPANGVSGSYIYFTGGDVPSTLLVGDYVSSAGECIIPGIPPDLHTLLADRAAARILAALGDTAGLQVQEAKIAESEKNQGMLLDTRVDGSVIKVAPKHTTLRYGKMGNRRRL